MKVYVKANGVTLVGKAWQIKYLLKKYMKQFQTMEEWIASDSRSKRSF